MEHLQVGGGVSITVKNHPRFAAPRCPPKGNGEAKLPSHISRRSRQVGVLNVTPEENVNSREHEL